VPRQQLLELPQKLGCSAGVAPAELQPSDNHLLPGHFLLSVCNMALGHGQTVLKQFLVHNAAPPSLQA